MKSIGYIVLGAVIGALTAGAIAQDLVAESFAGVYYSNPSWERYDMSVGITTSGVPLRPERRQHQVSQLNLPDYFGELVDVTSHTKADVLWFKSDTGVLRSAIVPDPDQTLYRIMNVPITNLELRHKP